MKWYNGSIAEAVAEAKRSNRLFLVYIEGNDDMSKAMTETYNDSSLIEKLTSVSIIAIKITANSVPYQQFCAVYPVLVIPSSFFIGVNGSPMEIITGHLPASEFCNKVDKLYEEHNKLLEIKTGVKSHPSTSSVTAELSEPSTSQTLTSAESSVSLEEKVQRAKALVEAQRLNKAKEEEEKERQQEIERRNTGRAMQQAEKKKQDDEMKEWAKNQAKEKEEERLAREKVKAMIAQDRAERAAKYQRTKEAEEAERQKIAKNREEAERAMKNAAMSSNDARIQFRLPDGSSTNHCFPADATLEEARRFVRNEMRPPFSNFTFCTTFPRRHFTENNYSESLRDLQLAPSAVLLILPAQAVTNLGPGTGFLSNLIWNLFTPIRIVWNFIRSFLPGRTEENRPTESKQGPSSAEASQNKGNERQPTSGRREGSFAKREGNIFRINNQSDDDENNTWNGNSTQQM